MPKNEQATAIYHVVRPHEGFEETVRILGELLAKAEEQSPGKPRFLYLDIEGHRNAQGGFDHDMFELQVHFVADRLVRYCTKVCMPLAEILNKGSQDNEVPAEWLIIPEQGRN